MKSRLSQNFDCEDECYLIEITAQIADYKLAWLLNRHFGASFQRFEDVPIYQKNGSFLLHSLFIWSPMEFVDYYIIHHGSDANSLFSTFYFFIKGVEQKEDSAQFFLKLHEIKELFTVSEINLTTLQQPSGKKNASQKRLFDTMMAMLSDIELHLIDIKNSQKNPSAHKNKNDKFFSII